MAISIDKQTISIDGIEDISVSDIVEDEVNGGFVRRILFYTDAADVQNRTATIELILTADDNNKLKLITPELEF